MPVTAKKRTRRGGRRPGRAAAAPRAANPKQPARRVGKALAGFVRGKAKKYKRTAAKAKQPAPRVGKALAGFSRKPNPRRKTRAGKPRRPARGRNPGGDELQQAAAMYEGFHGKAASKVREVTELARFREVVADLGRMVCLEVAIDEDQVIELTFKGVRLATSPDGGQLYFVGNQRLDLAALNLDQYLPKDHLTVGPVDAIVYFTSKEFHDFEPLEYRHAFGVEEDEEGNVVAVTGERPWLHYDVLSEKFFLTGGSYQVRPEGIVN